MSSTKQNTKVCTWIEENDVDYDLLNSIISYKALSIEQTVTAYNLKYNKKYDKKLTHPMTANILTHIVNTIEKHPNTFNKCNIKLCGNILHTPEKKYTHLPELIKKIKDENMKLISDNRKLLVENINLLIKYEALYREKDSNKSNEKMDSAN